MIDGMTAGSRQFGLSAYEGWGGQQADSAPGALSQSGSDAPANAAGPQPSPAGPQLSLSRSQLSEVSISNLAFVTLAPGAGAPAGTTYRYAILSDSTGGAFQIQGDRLYVVDSSKLDYETRPNPTLTVRVTDETGLSADHVVSLQVTDAPGVETRYSAGAVFGLTASPGTHSGPSHAALPGGGFVSVWSGSDGSGLGARAQLFDGAGKKVGGEIAVNADATGTQSSPRVVALGTGFVVSWTDSVGDDSGGGIKAQLFDSTGTKIGGEFLVNTTTAAAQNASDIDALAGGGFVIVWADASATGGDTVLRAIRAQLFDDAGARIGGEFLVNTTTAGAQFGASVAALAGGGFVVSWTDQGGSAVDADGTALHAQLFDAAGTKLGDELLIPTHTAGIQAVSSVVALPAGGFVVVWHSNDNGADFSIKAQMFDRAGARIGSEFSVETNTSGDQLYVMATALPGGGFAVTWEDHSRPTAPGRGTLVAQLFDAAGDKVGDEFDVAPDFSGAQYLSSGLTALSSGALVAGWTSGSNVFGRLLTPGGAPEPAAADVYATNETRAISGRLAHSGEGEVTAVNGAAVAVGERIVLPSGAALVLRADGSFGYEPNGAFGHLVATAPTGYHHMTYATSATDRFTYSIGGVVHEAVVTIAGVKSDDDTYYGAGTGWGVGNDDMPGTAGAERLVGGAGNDSYVVNHVKDVVVEMPGEGIDSVSTTLAFYQLPDNVENLSFRGSGGATLIGNSLNNRLTGGSYGDVLFGGGGNDVFSMYGGDSATGGTGDDIFYLGLGHGNEGTGLHRIVGGGGNDLLTITANSAFSSSFVLTNGGPAITDWKLANPFFEPSERIEASGISNIRITTGAGELYARYMLFLHDEFTPAGTTLTIEATGLYDGESLTLLAASNRETDAHLHITGGRGNDDLTGGALADILRGGDGKDRLDGGAGDDTIDGGDGDDSLYATAAGAGGTKTVIGGSGTDRLYADFSSSSHGVTSGLTGSAPDAWPHNWSGWISNGAGTTVNYSGIESVFITGSNLADQLTGTGGNDVLDGGGGADVMAGGLGSDRYIVDSLDDVIVESASGDADEIHTALAAYTLLAANVEKLVGTAVTGQTLTGNGANNTIVGGIGNDILDGGGGTWDVLIGGKGNDIYYVASGTDVQELASEGTDEVRTALASYTLPANVEKLTGLAATGQILRGNTSSNTIVGGAGNDRLEGGGGIDTLDGGAGADTMLGGTSNDTYTVDDIGDVVTEYFNEGTDTVLTALASYALGTNVERLTGTLAAGQSLSGNELANVVTGGAGSDVLSGNGGDDTLRGNDGHDSLSGGSGTDVLEGGAGDDQLDGGAGTDTMRGGTGDDVYVVAESGDIVIELAGEGVDEVRTALGSRSDPAQMYVLGANIENFTGTSAGAQGVYGNALDNVIRMGAGGDLVVLDGGGNDRVDGGGGNDFLYFGGAFAAGDRADGGAGSDTVALLGNYALAFGADDLVSIERLAVYSSGNAAAPNGYSLVMHDGNVAAGTKLTVVAQSLLAGETLMFDGAAETDGGFNVRAGRGDDTITGGAGADTVWGNLGADTLKGGAGADVFEYRAAAESTAASRDTILDFAKGDKINLGGIDADGDAANGNSKFAFIGGAAFSGTAGELRVSQDPNLAHAWLVEGDTDGDRVADFSLIVVAPDAYPLGKEDFWL
jgi:Ca2+-binding RTX toxin-like protein